MFNFILWAGKSNLSVEYVKIEAIDLPVRGKGTMRFEFNDGKVQMVRADGTILKDKVTGTQFRSYLGK